MTRFRAPISTAVAIAFGIMLLVSLALPELAPMRAIVLSWAILLAAVALVLGLANLLQVHVQKLQENDDALHSLVLVLALLGTFAITLIQGRQGIYAEWIFTHIQVPLEASMMALLAVTLTLAAARLLRTRSDFGSYLFIVAVIVILLGSAPFFGFDLPLFSQTLAPYVTRVLANGGVRGLLLGVALGTLTTGLRILLGADRPFGG